MAEPAPLSVSGIAALVRWPNAALAVCGVIVGAVWSRAGLSLSAREWAGVGFASAAAIALTATANAWNDASDAEIDAVSHPNRPIPSGRATREQAVWLAATSAVVGVALASMARAALGALAVLVVAGSIGYSPWLKRAGLAGNIAVAILASLPFLFGAAVVDAWRSGLALVAVAAPLHLARELTKDLDDAPGDAGRRRTLPVVIGDRAGRRAVVAVLAAFIVALAWFTAQDRRLAIYLLPAAALVAWAGARVLRGRRGSATVLKLAMLCALVGLIAARV